MKAILYRRYGPPNVLEYVDLPKPKISSKQILVKVHATSINPVDWKLRNGQFRIPGQKLPRIPGSDFAGEIVEVGEDVTRFRPGDHLYGMLSPFSGGACAEYVAVPEKNASLMPKNLSFAEAASVPMAGMTALQALRDKGEIKIGDRILINGASGGVGTFAVQVGKILGGNVTAVTSSKNQEFVKNLGGDQVIDYATEDFTKTNTNYEIIFDTVSKRSFSECKVALSSKGVYIRTLPSFDTILQMMMTFIMGGKKACLINLSVRVSDLELLKQWLENGKVRPFIDRTFSLSKTSEAHAYSESGHPRGKIVILISD